jgi:hypothetical protein
MLATFAKLSPSELDHIEALVARGAVKGDRYQSAQMQHLDSEK